MELSSSQRKTIRFQFDSCMNYIGYIFIDELGRLLKPDYLTKVFQNLLIKNELRPICFHDLRHFCASLLLKNGVSMKAIQEWLVHSHFSTTANFYAYLEYDSKKESANAIDGTLMVTGLNKSIEKKQTVELPEPALIPLQQDSVIIDNVPA